MSKGIGVTKSNVLREIVVTLLASTRVFHKKKVNEFLIFVIFDVLFVDVRHILIIAGLKGFLWRMDEPIKLFHFVINGFHVFGNKFFYLKKKKQVLHNFAFFSFFLIVAYFH